MSDKEIALELVKALLEKVSPFSKLNDSPESFKEKSEQLFETYLSYYERLKELK